MTEPTSFSQGRVVVTGATGYIGGRLVPALLDAGYAVRCLSRDVRKLSQDEWRDRVEVVEADVLEPSTLDGVLDDCEVAFYLVHSMDGGHEGFSERDRRAAENFREAAERAGVRRIVYLGGLGRGEDLSDHLASRQEVGRVLSAGSVTVIEVRAAVIIGSGSVSFEMMRYLTEVLPVMVTPRWVRTLCQPIAIRNVLEILIAAVAKPVVGGEIWEVGGPDRLTYSEMMQIYAEEAGLRRRIIIPVPVLSPQLSRHWIGLVTPLPTGVAKPLVNSLRNEVIVDDNRVALDTATELVPFRDAVRRALSRSADASVVTRWTDAARSPAEASPADPDWAGGTLQCDERTVETTVEPEDLFWAFSRIGGDVGYYAWDSAWRVRGFLDAALGGVGLRRGRRHPQELHLGETVDFWRVAAIDPGRRLQLAAEMKVPGEAWLEFSSRVTSGRTVLVQRAIFRPRGLWGRLYWIALIPAHAMIFGRMARRIVEVAEQRAARHDQRFV